MLSFPTDVNCIEALYQSGDITPRGLAAMVFDRPSDIAPIACRQRGPRGARVAPITRRAAADALRVG